MMHHKIVKGFLASAAPQSRTHCVCVDSPSLPSESLLSICLTHEKSPCVRERVEGTFGPQEMRHRWERCVGSQGVRRDVVSTLSHGSCR